MAAAASLAPSTFDGSTFFNDTDDLQIVHGSVAQVRTVVGTDSASNYPLANLTTSLLPGQGVIVNPMTSAKKPGYVAITLGLRRLGSNATTDVSLAVSADPGGPMIGTLCVMVTRRPQANTYRVRAVGHHVEFSTGSPAFAGLRTDWVDVVVP